MSCRGKHEHLYNSLKQKGYNVRFRICTFLWSDLNMPDEIASIPHDKEYKHMYLEIQINSEWKIIDCT